MTDRELLDTDGENLALRWFLAAYGGIKSPTVKQMRDHLDACGFEGCWPDWVNDPANAGHLTKGGAQLWIRHLLHLEKAAVDHREQFEQLMYAHYLEKHAAGKTTDKDEPAISRDGLLWRDEQGNYGVLMFNAAWKGYQSALAWAGF